MKVDEALIEYIATLSRLDFSAEELSARKKDMTDILNYMEKLNELDTAGVAELVQPFEQVNRFRADEVTNGDRRADMLANAPEVKGDFFKVYKTVEE